MTRSARRAKRFSSAWIVDCGGLSTQPWWRPCSVAWTVTSSLVRAASASLAEAAPTSQSWPCTRSKSSSASSSAPAAAMWSFILRTQATNACRSSGISGSGIRWTITPWRSSRALERVPPRVSTCTSTPARTSASESLRTWRASPPSTIGGYSQDRMRIRTAGGPYLTQLPEDPRDGHPQRRREGVVDPEEQVEREGQGEDQERRPGARPVLGGEHRAEHAG